MAETLNIQIRKRIGENLKLLIQEKETQTDLRNLDAVTGKDHSWLGKVFNGTQNMTIDSLLGILEKFEIQPLDVFKFEVDYKNNGIR